MNLPLWQTWRLHRALSKFYLEISGEWRVREHSKKFWSVYWSELNIVDQFFKFSTIVEHLVTVLVNWMRSIRALPHKLIGDPYALLH